MKKAILFLFFFLLGQFSFAQASEESKRAQAFEAIKALKNGGVLVVRLETSHVKVKSLERALAVSNLKEGKRKRTQAMLDETIARCNAINRAMADAFSDSFNFCPVYFSFDTNATALKDGRKSGIFVGRDLKPDPSISISDTAAVFVAYYHEKSGDYPSDGLMLRKLRGTLDEPFPYFTAIRESFINEYNTPRLYRAIVGLDRRLQNLWERIERKKKD